MENRDSTITTLRYLKEKQDMDSVACTLLSDALCVHMCICVSACTDGEPGYGFGAGPVCIK